METLPDLGEVWKISSAGEMRMSKMNIVNHFNVECEQFSYQYNMYKNTKNGYAFAKSLQ